MELIHWGLLPTITSFLSPPDVLALSLASKKYFIELFPKLLRVLAKRDRPPNYVNWNKRARNETTNEVNKRRKMEEPLILYENIQKHEEEKTRDNKQKIVALATSIFIIPHSDLKVSTDMLSDSLAFQIYQQKIAGLQKLINMGADINRTVHPFFSQLFGHSGLTPLHLSSIFNNYKATLILVSSNACLHKGADRGILAIDLAAYNGSREVLRILLQSGSSQPLNSADLETLVDEALEVGKTMENFNPLISHAVYCGKLHLVEWLLVFYKDSPSNSALFLRGLSLPNIAILGGHAKIMKLLWKFGLVTQQTKPGTLFTPLNLASQLGAVQVVEYLLHMGCNDGNGGGINYSSIELAAFSGHTKVVELLLKNNLKNLRFHMVIDAPQLARDFVNLGLQAKAEEQLCPSILLMILKIGKPSLPLQILCKILYPGGVHVKASQVARKWIQHTFPAMISHAHCPINLNILCCLSESYDNFVPAAKPTQPICDYHSNFLTISDILFIASFYGDIELAHTFSKQTNFNPFVHVAAYKGHTNFVNEFLPMVEQIEGMSKVEYRTFVFEKACEGGNLDLATHLLSMDIGVGNALNYAACGGHIEVVRLLLRRGMNFTPDAPPLHLQAFFALINGNLDVAIELVNISDNFIKKSTTNVELVKACLHRYAFSPLDLSHMLCLVALYKNLDISKLLLEALGGVADLRDAFAFAVIGGDVKIAKLLLGKGVAKWEDCLATTNIFINGWGKLGNTIQPFFSAVLHNNVEMVEFLLDCGVDVNITDSNGKSALMYATLKGFDSVPETVKLLVERGATASLALSNACNQENSELVRYLMAHFPDGFDATTCKVKLSHQAAADCFLLLARNDYYTMNEWMAKAMCHSPWDQHCTLMIVEALLKQGVKIPPSCLEYAIASSDPDFSFQLLTMYKSANPWTKRMVVGPVAEPDFIARNLFKNLQISVVPIQCKKGGNYCFVDFESREDLNAALAKVKCRKGKEGLFVPL